MYKNKISLKHIRKLDERVFPQLLEKNCLLHCVNEVRSKTKSILLKALYDNDREFWLKDNTDWSYFIESHTVDAVLLQLKNDDLVLEKRLSQRENHIEKTLSEELQFFTVAAPEERLKTMSKMLDRLRGIIHSRNTESAESNQVFVEASWYSWLMNKVTLDEISELSDSDAKNHSFEVARLTEQVVESLTTILAEEDHHYTFMHSMVDRSNGETLRHMIRTFVLTYRFILYFNKKMLNEGLASKLRAVFQERYSHWYSSLLPHISAENLSLENVFKGGIRAVPRKELQVYSAGFLLHDIGKQRYMEYYEGSEQFDSRKVESHAKTGYRMLLQKTVYSSKIAAIAGFHHEYYGHESGYGYFRELYSLMQLDNKTFRHDSCISYDLNDLNRFRALAYIPVKFLEIVDVYDAVTDPYRSYKSHLNKKEALAFIREDFVQKNKKLDIILFDLFEQFVVEEGQVV